MAMQTETTTYFVMKESVYFSDVIDNKTLLYDTATGHKIYFENKTDIDICCFLYNESNNGVIDISRNQHCLNHPTLSRLITEGFADYETIKNNQTKPFIFLPFLSLNDDLDKTGDGYDEILSLVRSNAGIYLKSISLQLSDACTIGCQNCLNIHCQTGKCASNQIPTFVTIEQVKMIKKSLSTTQVQNINLFGGDLSQFLVLKEAIMHFLQDSTYQITVTLQLTHSNIELFRKISNMSERVNFEFVILPNNYNKDLKMMIYKMRDFSNLSFLFYLSSNKEYEFLEYLNINNYNIKYSIFPIGVKDEISPFLDNCLCYSEEDIFSRIFSMREIFRNQKLNANFFGHFIIYANGSIRANPNTSIIGNIFKDDIRDIIYKELVVSKTWRMTRKGYKCSKCLLQDLCPPVSNYELVFDRLFCSLI